MEENKQHSQLFTLRLWVEELSEDESEWRGQLCHVTSGEIRHFRDWAKLVPLVLEMLPGQPTARPNHLGHK